MKFYLRHDGLDKLWEDDVNWKTLNPNGEDDEFEPQDDLEWFQSQLHENVDFVPTYVDDLIDTPDPSETDKFKKLRSMLANHLNHVYRSGNLKWPLPRKEIHERYNALPRCNFPNATDI